MSPFVQSSAALITKPKWTVWWSIGQEMARRMGYHIIFTHDEILMVPNSR